MFTMHIAQICINDRTNEAQMYVYVVPTYLGYIYRIYPHYIYACISIAKIPIPVATSGILRINTFTNQMIQHFKALELLPPWNLESI